MAAWSSSSEELDSDGVEGWDSSSLLQASLEELEGSGAVGGVLGSSPVVLSGSCNHSRKAGSKSDVWE